MMKTTNEMMGVLFTWRKIGIGFLLFGFLAGCAPKLTFYVTRPPNLPIRGIDTIALGAVEDDLNAPIPFPGNTSNTRSPGAATLTPRISRFQSNSVSADLVKSLLLSGLSQSGHYRIAQIGDDGIGFSGVVPDQAKTGVITARVKYFAFTEEESEKMFHLLLATRRNLDFRDRLALMGFKATVIAEAERSKKGFEVNTPYIETVAAMEIAFDLIRQSNGEKVVETQTYRSYFAKKWGGDQETSHLPRQVKRVIATTRQPQPTLFDQVAELGLAMSDPERFLAQGGRLMNDPSVPLNKLDTKTLLAREIVSEYLKQISQYTVETTLDIANGDDIAVNFLRGGAFEMAINRLESIQRSEDDSYNLALAYESVAEYFQAAKYYREALDKDPGNRIYKASLRRVTR